MDLYCPRCGEPWDIDTLHEEAELRLGGRESYLKQRAENDKRAEEHYGRIFKQVSQEFRAQGCVALREFRGTDRPCDLKSDAGDTRATLASAAYDLLGEDIDGAAAMLEDWEMGY